MKKSILNWLDEQANNGNELAIKWEGGGDSGWAYFEIDGESVENDYTSALVGYMYDKLDYGSWAGEFSANGTAIYNPETKCFEGTDYYGEEDHAQIECDIKISIPKDYWFDTFHLEVECYHEESCNVAASFNVKNGFLTDKHSDFCSNLQEELRDYFNDLFSSQELADNYEFRGCTDSWVFEKSEAKEENDMLVFHIVNVEIQTTDSTDRDIVLEITEEMAEDINESLK
jgi:hypothetical protein